MLGKLNDILKELLSINDFIVWMKAEMKLDTFNRLSNQKSKLINPLKDVKKSLK